MKTKNTIILSAFMLFSTSDFLSAQSPVTGIVYTYDASGNRIKREPSFGIVERKAAPAEEQKTETAVVANNMVASFTPNPTATGNFTVVVSKKDFAANEKNDVTIDKPQIFIYNPLGELIQQESALYNEQVNINLSRHSRGMYLIKIQSGKELLLQRMVYE